MRIITADINKEKGILNRYFQKCIGAGRAGEIMRHTAFEQLKMIQCECPFEYIRFHGLFHEEMAIVSRDDEGKLVFNFQYVDLLFDSLLDIGIRPVVELGLMPDTMGSDEKYVFNWKMNITPPKDINEWSLLVEETVKHFTHRYGKEEVKKWYFEVWNEPNHPAFFSENDSVDEYFKLYDAAALAVKKICSDYKVGGPATAGLEWLDEMIEHCNKNNIPIDFLSGHYYCVEGAFDANGTKQLYIRPTNHLTDRFQESGALCRKKGYPLLITEWSASYSPRDRVHDSYFSAPFILEIIKRSEGYADMLSYWVYTDIFEETGAPPTPFHGGFGLINVQSLPKPAYHAYAFLHKLGEHELAYEDKSAYICRTQTEIQILLWNLSYPEKEESNNSYFGRLLPSKQLDDAKIVLCGFEKNKSYNITVETVGYKKGDVYSAYLEEDPKELPTREQTAKLLEKATPERIVFDVTSDNSGTLEFFIPQTENQVDLVMISLV